MVGLVDWLKNITTPEKAYKEFVRRAKRTFKNEIGKADIPNMHISKDMAHRAKTRLNEVAMGFLQFKGELKDASKFMQSNQIPPVIKNAYEMIASLKNTGASGLNINSIAAMGGATLIAEALSFASSYQSSIEQENTENEEDPLEAFLRGIYRILFELEPLDENGVETPEYIKWRDVYILTLGDEFVEFYNSRKTS